MVQTGRSKQRARSRLGKNIIIEDRLRNYMGKFRMLSDGRFNSRNKWVIDRLEVDPFVRQLHVPVIIIVVHIIASVVHSKKPNKPHTFIESVMLHEVRHQCRNLQKLVQRGVIQ